VTSTALALSAISARADVRVKASQGGQVGPFLDLFEEVRRTFFGEPKHVRSVQIVIRRILCGSRIVFPHTSGQG
jgi:hypothetical protein